MGAAKTAETTSRSALEIVDETLAKPDLLPEAGALLLLRVCQLAQTLCPGLLSTYWEVLLRVHQHLKGSDLEAFQGLRSSLEPSQRRSLGGFAQSIVDSVSDAIAAVAYDRQEALGKLRDCEQRLRRRRWPFGKQPAWVSLITAMEALDRPAALALIGKIRGATQRNLLVQWNRRAALSMHEWDIACRHQGVFGGVCPTILEILDSDHPFLHLSPSLAKKVGHMLLPKIHQAVAQGADERKVEQEREESLNRYRKLVGCLAEETTDTAESLLESLFMDTVGASRFNETWPDRFTALRHLIRFWVSWPGLRDRAKAFLMAKAPKHLRDLCLTEWWVWSADSPAQADDAWESLRAECSDPQTVEAWFLVSLVMRGWGQTALDRARSCDRSQALLPQVRRAWLCLSPETARSAISKEDVAGDAIGEFFLLPPTTDRMEFLRSMTECGKRSLPKPFWTQPSITALLPNDLSRSEAQALLHIYSKKESADKQFREYVRLHGYANYGYEDIDVYVMAALVAWGDAHPQEIEAVCSRMWNAMKPDESLLTLDVLRNAIFERCRVLFAADPALLTEQFVDWVKRTLVDRQVRYQAGDTIYTLSFKETVPFLFCLLAAQKVAAVSIERCDEIIRLAIAKYTADEDLMAAASSLYASDKGLKAITPPTALKGKDSLEAWQRGVIQASIHRILAAMLPETKPPESAATESGGSEAADK